METQKKVLELKEVEERVRKIFKQYSTNTIEDKELEVTDNFSDFAVNSVDFIKIIVGIETEFDFEFHEDDLQMERFKSLEELIEYIQVRTSEAG